MDKNLTTHPHLRAWIKYKLALRDLTLTDIARQLGLAQQSVNTALLRPYPRVEAAIAEALDMRPEDLWPERYAYRAEKARRAEARKRRMEKSRKADGGHGATITAGRRRRKSARAAEGAEGRPES